MCVFVIRYGERLREIEIEGGERGIKKKNNQLKLGQLLVIQTQ